MKYTIGVTATDIPDMQQWGEQPTDYWPKNEWINWFFAMKNSLGVEQAKSLFILQWNKNEPFSQAITAWGRSNKLNDIPHILSTYGIYFSNGYASLTPPPAEPSSTPPPPPPSSTPAAANNQLSMPILLGAAALLVVLLMKK